MRDDFGGLFAASPSTLRRDPTAAEVAGGLACGAAGRDFWNEVIFTESSILAELNTVLGAADITPDETRIDQLLTALTAIIAKQGTSIINALKIVGGVPQIYAVPGLYTLPLAAGITFGIPECRGAGGGGGGASSQAAAASGGGGGGRAQKVATTTAATVLSITVGAGGNAGNGGASPGNGSAGGTSSIVIQSGSVVDYRGNVFAAGTTLCAATGGGGGTSSTSGAQSSSRGLGGIASGGDVNDAGDPGGYGYLQGPYIGGVGGASPGGAATQPNFAAYGITSTNPGTGGSGASSNDAGGAGSPGRVTVQHP